MTAARFDSILETQNGHRELDPGAAPRVDGTDRRDGVGEASPLVEHELRYIRLGVVLRWALALALTTLAAWWLALGLFWASADAFGFTRRVEQLASDVGFEGFRLSSGPVFVAFGLLGVAWVLGLVVMAILAAAAYNAYAKVLGGIRVVARETRLPTAAPPN